MRGLDIERIPIDEENELVVVEKEELAQAHEGGYEWAINLIAEPNYEKIPRYESLDLPSLSVYSLTPEMAIVQPKERGEPVYVQVVGPENESRTYARFDGSLKTFVSSLMDGNFLLEGFDDTTRWLVSSVAMTESIPDDVLDVVQDRRDESLNCVTELET
jgi:hypothetical protein